MQLLRGMLWRPPVGESFPQPGLLAVTTDYAVLDQDLCTACGACVDRCRMDAMTLEVTRWQSSTVTAGIGCGLCVSTCPEDALSLAERPEAELQGAARENRLHEPSSEFESRFR